MKVLRVLCHDLTDDPGEASKKYFLGDTVSTLCLKKTAGRTRTDIASGVS